MIRTVLGDIENPCGNVLMHEHIQCVSNDMLNTFGKAWLDETNLEDCSVSILSKLKEQIKLGVYVDGTAVDLGRNVPLLKRISEKTGVHIVASTGLYYYPSMLSCSRSARELSEWFLYECENGMEGTDIRPGILKCAADGCFTEDMQKRVRAISMVQAQTGLPMYAHCSHTDKLAFEMMEIFSKEGVCPEKTIFGHASRRMDVAYLENVLKEGYYICIDQSFDGDEEKVADAVYALCEKGYGKKLLFSLDRPIYNDFASPGSLGLDFSEEVHISRYSFLLHKIIPALKKRGCTEEHCEMFCRENAIDLLSI